MNDPARQRKDPSKRQWARHTNGKMHGRGSVCWGGGSSDGDAEWGVVRGGGETPTGRLSIPRMTLTQFCQYSS